MEKINIAELLKDCPRGMELDCINYNGVVTFEEISNCPNYPIKISVKYDNEYFTHTLTKYGQTCKSPYNKCVIFPKGKTTWEGFHIPFKDGDIIYLLTEHNNEYITIFKDSVNDHLETHIDFVIITSKCSLDSLFYVDNIKEQRLATEEEKEKLFQAIKDNGYKWNAETKTLEKLPRFKVGDIIRTIKNAPVTLSNIIITKVKSSGYEGVIGDTTNKAYINLKYQDNYELVPVEPKFKVGDRVKHISAYTSGIIVKVDDKGYYIDYPKGEGVCYISFTLEKDYELVPNKFDISTLKPFDKVLVRFDKNSQWKVGMFSHIDEDLNGFCYKYVTISYSYPYMIPYKGNEHLCGTTNDCDEFYKIWKK